LSRDIGTGLTQNSTPADFTCDPSLWQGLAVRECRSIVQTAAGLRAMTYLPHRMSDTLPLLEA
jgi:hypothetical protein